MMHTPCPELEYGKLYKILVWDGQPPVSAIYVGRDRNGALLSAVRWKGKQNKVEYHVCRFNSYEIEEEGLNIKYNGSKLDVLKSKKLSPLEKEYLKERFRNINRNSK